jgi:hypothetical protein
MKKVLAILMLCGVIAGYAQNTPPFAASTKTWVFGDQTWSDAVQIPECNKETFGLNDTEPQCRSYTTYGKTWYYYNLAYVNKHQDKMCPSPWRVPSRVDFELLTKVTTSPASTAGWDLAGHAVGQNEIAFDWEWGCVLSATRGYAFSYHGTLEQPDEVYRLDAGIDCGFQVRCVK